MLPKLSTTLGLALVFSGAAISDKDTNPANEPSKIDIAMEKYERTGEMKTCINPRRIRSMKFVDEKHIIFKVSGKTSYLNELPRRCHNMDFYESISYQVRGSTICSKEIFHVLDRTPIPGPFCSFGKFEKIVKKPKPEANS